MAMTINTNVVSINAQRNLGLSGGSLATSMQRLSSGLRVNSAKDDAAGLAIAERMSAQSKGLAVAARNANDGISLAQTAEGALSKVGDMLQRARELAVQASNATNSADDRKAMQSEVAQLVSEIDRVAKTTNFNGKNLLDGSFGGALFQVGANAGNNITVGALVNTSAAKLSTVSFGSASVAAADVDTADGTVTGFNTAIAAGANWKITVGTTDYSLDAVAKAGSGKERLSQVVAAINAKSADSGVTAFIADDGGLEVRSSKVDPATGLALGVTFGSDFSVVNTALDAGDLEITAAAAGGEIKGIATLSVKTQADAWEALKKIDSALDQVNSARGDLGALQTRFEKSVENIDIQKENISAARGRIVDADFATETANLSRSQILQQAGTAMVAQANQLPQNVLSLLR